MPIDRRLLTHFEWLLPALVMIVTGIGIASIYSATHEAGVEAPSPLALRQLAYLGAGIVIMLLAVSFDYRRLDHQAFWVYGFCILLLVAVPLFGVIGGGSRRWIRLGPVSIQPSEFVKLGLVVVLARWFSRLPSARLDLRDAVPAFLLTALPAAIILSQPDLGTAVHVGLIAVSMMLVGGVRLRWFVVLAAPVVLLAPFLWGFLKEYQQKRILMFLDPTQDPLGAGYHIIQSKIAVGSGMLYGKGFLQGTQNSLDFLPEQHTDFVFSVFAEEWGFIGAAVLLLLYLAIMVRGLVIAARARDRFGLMLVAGVLAIVFWQILVNVGMTTGLMPVVGITLPFLSYGGSSLVCLLLGIGLVMNVSMRRFLF
jgi:rod shape determining protein RodA